MLYKNGQGFRIYADNDGCFAFLVELGNIYKLYVLLIPSLATLF